MQKTDQGDPRWMKVKEVAAVLRVERGTVIDKIHRGELDAINVGGFHDRSRRYRIHSTDLQAFLETRRIDVA